SVEAYRWLVRYHSSSEARRRHELGHFLVTSETSFRILPGVNVRPETGQKPPEGTRNSTEAQQSSRLTLFSEENHKAARRWLAGCLVAEPRLAALGPLFVAAPAVQFPMQAARRALLDFDTPVKWYQRYLTLTAPPPGMTIPPGTNGFRDAAAMELWLTK